MATSEKNWPGTTSTSVFSRFRSRSTSGRVGEGTRSASFDHEARPGRAVAGSLAGGGAGAGDVDAGPRPGARHPAGRHDAAAPPREPALLPVPRQADGG